MKVLVRGNTVLVQTSIEEKDYKELKNYPEVFTVKDEDANQVYKLGVSETFSDVSKYGINCNTVYQGKLTASTIVDTADGYTVQDFIDDIKPALFALKENEVVINLAIMDLQNRLEGLDESIEIEE